jgi:AraC family transcriptional regulator of arabinose operon
MIFTHQGKGQVATPAGSAVLEPGDLLLFAPDDYQDYATDPGAKGWDYTWVHFVAKAHWVPLLQWPADRNGLRIIRSPGDHEWPEVSAALHRMTTCYWSYPMPHWMELTFNALEEVLLWASAAQSKAPMGRLDPRIRRVIDYLVTHVGEPFELAPLAEQCGLSISGMAHLFRQETGVSPRRFLERCRMELAMDLLRFSQTSIAEIALKVGYPSPYYFTNRFRAFYGTSPSQVRQRSAGKQKLGSGKKL